MLARLLGAGRPLVMGVLNVTPDSFSDGGRFFDPHRAIEHAKKLPLKISYKDQAEEALRNGRRRSADA